MSYEELTKNQKAIFDRMENFFGASNINLRDFVIVLRELYYKYRKVSDIVFLRGKNV